MDLATETQRWREADLRHHLHPFSNHAELGRTGSRIITRGEGCWLWDSEGNRILDGMAGLWCVNVGYGRQELVEAAARQMSILPYYNTFFQTATPPAIDLAERLAAITPPGLDKIFFTNSGSEANETAVKAVRYYWNLQDKPKKKTIISRAYAYHGVTLATASMSGLAVMHPQADLPLPGFVHIAAPYWYAHGGSLEPEGVAKAAAMLLEKQILDLGADNVGAFIGEPIQGAGGVIIPPPGYWPAIQRICERHDVLLIADEIICGFGRTGKWWGADRFDFVPDIMTMAKGLSSGYLPIAAVALGPRVADALINAGQEFAHGFTYSGHPVAAAVALENLRIIEDEGLHERGSGPLGDHFARSLQTLADHPLVGEVRSCGLIAALELVADKATRRYYPPERRVGLTCREHCLANGLVMRAVRDVMVLAPPLIITEAEIDELVAKARRALDQTAADLARAGPDPSGSN